MTQPIDRTQIHPLLTVPLAPRLRRDRLTSTIGATCLTFCVSFVIAFGLLVPSGAQHFGVSVSAYLVQYTLLAGVSGLCFALVGKLVPKVGIRNLIIIGGSITTLSILAMSLSTNLYVFYGFAALHGVGWSACTLVAANIVINGWHLHKRKGTVMGLVLTGNAVGGVVWGFVIPLVVANFGWVGGMQLLALVAGLMMVVPGILLIKNPPTAIAARHTGSNPKKLPSMRAAGFGTVMMLLMIGTFALSLEGGSIQILPTLLEDRGLDAARTGMLVSIYAIGGIITKPLFGYLYDKIGANRATFVALLAFVIGFPWLAVTQSGLSYFMIIPLIALALTTFTVMVPLVVADAVGQARFPDAYGQTMTIGSLGLAIAAPLWGLIFDVTGSFNPALFAAAILGSAGLILLLIARRNGRKKLAATINITDATDTTVQEPSPAESEATVFTGTR